RFSRVYSCMPPSPARRSSDLLIFGPLSDIQGRKRPLLTTLSVYTVVSLLAAFSHHIWIFIGLRFIQGISAAAGIVIARASAKDLFDEKELTKFIALLEIGRAH